MLGDKDMEELMGYFADDAVFSQAFNPGGARNHEGKAAIQAAYEQIFANIDELISSSEAAWVEDCSANCLPVLSNTLDSC